jgi:hypothetical protein
VSEQTVDDELGERLRSLGAQIADHPLTAMAGDRKPCPFSHI